MSRLLGDLHQAAQRKLNTSPWKWYVLIGCRLIQSLLQIKDNHRHNTERTYSRKTSFLDELALHMWKQRTTSQNNLSYNKCKDEAATTAECILWCCCCSSSSQLFVWGHVQHWPDSTETCQQNGNKVMVFLSGGLLFLVLQEQPEYKDIIQVWKLVPFRSTKGSLFVLFWLQVFFNHCLTETSEVFLYQVSHIKIPSNFTQAQGQIKIFQSSRKLLQIHKISFVVLFQPTLSSLGKAAGSWDCQWYLHC